MTKPQTGSNSVPPTLAPSSAGVYRYHPARPYNGFSTSICSLFQHSRSDEDAEDAAYQTSTVRTDCCSLACCGILQSDRTRYLLTGQLPPSLFRRMWIHIFLPLSMFLLAGCAAVTIQDQYSNSFIVTCLVLLLILYISADCFRGTVKRRRVREELLWRMRELDMIDQGRGEEAIETELMVREAGSREDGTYGPVDLGQPKQHMDCVHRILGCAWVDHPNGDRSGEPTPSDFCARLWNFFSHLCCGKMCRCWFQFCGLCALAQEAREVERLIPAGRRRVDYVTFEPYFSYYNPIRMLRAASNSNLLAHYATLSHLSSTLVRTLAISVVSMLVLSFIPRFGGFTKGDLCVLIATLCQAFLILWLVHWKFHRFDISLDAVIKYFACGFIIVTGLAVFFELVETIVIHVFLIMAISLSGITKVQSQDFGSGVSSFGKLGVQFVSNGFGGGHGRYLQDQADDMSKTFAKEFPVITCVYLFVNAFLMAAMVEELAKYFGFRMIEHPDFLSDKQLQDGAEAVAAAERRAQREVALENEESEYEDDGSEGADGDPASSGRDCAAYEAMGDTVATTVDAAVSAAAEAVGATSPRAESNLTLVPAPTKTLNDKGAAITVAMVAVALGFACCENLVYIFIYNGSDLETKIAVLVLRSLFPIHPLAAAIQSIGVCRRDIENDRRFGVGRSILPAVLLHGSFDLAIMIASFLVAVNPDDEEFEEKAETASLVVSFVIFIIGAVYYLLQSRAQRKRLNELESAGTKAGLLPTATGAAADHALV